MKSVSLILIIFISLKVILWLRYFYKTPSHLTYSIIVKVILFQCECLIKWSFIVRKRFAFQRAVENVAKQRFYRQETRFYQIKSNSLKYRNLNKIFVWITLPSLKFSKWEVLVSVMLFILVVLDWPQEVEPRRYKCNRC